MIEQADVEQIGSHMRSFQRLLDAIRRLLKGARRVDEESADVAYLLSLFFSINCASDIATALYNLDLFDRSELPRSTLEALDSTTPWIFPDAVAFESSLPKFFWALGEGNGTAIRDTLDAMGVLALASIAEDRFGKLERIADRVNERARIIFLVELSLIAVDCGDYDSAANYMRRSRSYDPTSWEQYNLRTVEGLIALKDRQVDHAVCCLEGSLDACETDEFVSRSCGVRSPNFRLASELLKYQKRPEVVKYLTRCEDVWQHLRTQIHEWTHAIEAGTDPDFRRVQILADMEQPGVRLHLQWLRSCSLDEKPHPRLVKSRAEVLAGRARLRSQFRGVRDRIGRKPQR